MGDRASYKTVPGRVTLYTWSYRPLSVVGLRRKRCPVILTRTAWFQFLPSPTHKTCLCCSAMSGLMKLACLESRDLRSCACHITTNHITLSIQGVSCRISSDPSHVTSRQPIGHMIRRCKVASEIRSDDRDKKGHGRMDRACSCHSTPHFHHVTTLLRSRAKHGRTDTETRAHAATCSHTLAVTWRAATWRSLVRDQSREVRSRETRDLSFQHYMECKVT